MNLTDYEILGITSDDNYHTVKRAYYESRLWPYQLFVLIFGIAKLISIDKK